MTDWRTELELALQLADAADAFTLPRFEQRDFTLAWKDDRSEVTEVDRGCEAMLAERIVTERPDHGFQGEEHSVQGAAESPFRWLVDPIDGTSGFVRGIPVWATLIALTHRDLGVLVGVASAPAMKARWWATKGGGTFANGRKCAVSGVATISDAQVNVTHSPGWDELGLSNSLVEIGNTARRVRSFGDYWQHCLVAEGSLDVAIDAVGVKPYDLGAVRVIVEEAGGRFTDRLGVNTHEQPTAVSTNGLLHDEIIARLNP
jgi:histidinol-phosphatase